MGSKLSVRAGLLKGLCCLGLAAPFTFPARGAADRVSILHPTSKSTLVFFTKEKAAFGRQGGSKKDPDLWEVGGEEVRPLGRKFAHLRLGVDDRTGAVRFGEPGEKGFVTKWKIDWRRPPPAEGGPCTFQVAEGKYKGWFLAVSAKAEKRTDAAGKAVRAFPLVLVPKKTARCTFNVFEVSR
jgi:hypothetical protein